MSLKAVVVGATGMTGKALVRVLVDDPRFSSVRLLVRRPVNQIDPKVSQVVVDYDHFDPEVLDTGASCLFCCLGTTIKKAGSRQAFRQVDYDYVARLAEICEQRKIQKLLVISSMGADPSSRVFYSRVKGELESFLKERNIPQVGIVRPSLLLGDRDEYRFGERVASMVMQVFGFLFAGPLRKYKAIPASTVAEAMVAAALTGERGFGIYESDRLWELARSYRADP